MAMKRSRATKGFFLITVLNVAAYSNKRPEKPVKNYLQKKIKCPGCTWPIRLTPAFYGRGLG